MVSIAGVLIYVVDIQSLTIVTMQKRRFMSFGQNLKKAGCEIDAFQNNRALDTMVKMDGGKLWI